MSPVADFVTARAPQPAPHLCRESGVGADRVWRAGALLLESGREGLDRLGLHRRTVAKIVSVLVGSGVLDDDLRPTWKPSGDELPFSLSAVAVEPYAHRLTGVGADRLWRVVVLRMCLVDPSVAVLASVTGIGERQVRACLRAAGLLPGLNDAPVLRTATDWRDMDSWYGLFDDHDRVPDESTVPPRAKSTRPRGARSDWRGREVKDWTPTQSAAFFRDQHHLKHAGAPGDTGDVVKVGIVLASLRKKFGHDARVERQVALWLLDDHREVYRGGRKIPLWKKWITAISQMYDQAEAAIKADDPGYRDRFQRSGKTVEPVAAEPSGFSFLEAYEGGAHG